MAACIRGTKHAEDASDVTICPWNDDPDLCVFLDQPVPVTDIKTTQIRVHSDTTKAAILRCEGVTSDDTPFFSLELTTSAIRSMGESFQHAQIA